MATKLATYECAYCSTVFRSESSVCPHCGAVVAAPFFTGPDWVAALRRSDRERSN
jgi:hypothetical protein